MSVSGVAGAAERATVRRDGGVAPSPSSCRCTGFSDLSLESTAADFAGWPADDGASCCCGGSTAMHQAALCHLHLADSTCEGLRCSPPCSRLAPGDQPAGLTRAQQQQPGSQDVAQQPCQPDTAVSRAAALVSLQL